MARESSEAWRQLARTAPRTLLRVSTSECEGVNKCLESTHRRLFDYNVADMLRARDSGDRPVAPRGRTVEASLGKVKRLLTLHDGAGHVLALSATHLGLRQQGGDADTDADADAEARWQAWENRRAEASRFGLEAVRALRSAVTNLTVAAHVLHVVSRSPPPPPGSWSRKAWASEACRLVRCAQDEVAAARSAVRRMRHSVVLEFFDAWAVLISR